MSIFFEFYLPQGFRNAVGLITAIIMLWIAVPGLILWLLILGGSAVVLGNYAALKRKVYDHRVTDTYDQSNKAIQNGDQEKVIEAYEIRAHSYVKSSDWEATNWCVGDMLSLIAEAIVVLALIEMKQTTGGIIATVGYVGMLFGNIQGIAAFFVNLRSIEVANEKIEDC